MNNICEVDLDLLFSTPILQVFQDGKHSVLLCPTLNTLNFFILPQVWLFLFLDTCSGHLLAVFTLKVKSNRLNK